MTTDNEFKVAFVIIEDANRVVAGGKAHRWDVLKWGVAINLAVPAAMIATKADYSARCLYFLFAVAVAVVGIVLIFHYSRRMTGARKHAAKAYEYLQKNGIPLAAMTASAEEYTKPVGCFYDTEELVLFPIVLLLSCIPSLIIAKALTL